MILLEAVTMFSRWAAQIGCSKAGVMYTKDGIEFWANWEGVDRSVNRRFILFANWEEWQSKGEEELGSLFIERARASSLIHRANRKRIT